MRSTLIVSDDDDSELVGCGVMMMINAVHYEVIWRDKSAGQNWSDTVSDPGLV